MTGTIRRIIGLGILSLGVFFSPAQAQNGSGTVPKSFALYEEAKARWPGRLPTMEVDGVALQGLNLCKLAARCGGKHPFLALPTDLAQPGEAPCDPAARQLKLAYDGWCRAGIEHPTDPHLAPSYGPLVSCLQEGAITWLVFNNIAKVDWEPSAAGQAKAVEWLTHLPETVEPWSKGVYLIPPRWLDNLPPRAQQ